MPGPKDLLTTNYIIVRFSTLKDFFYNLSLCSLFQLKENYV